MSMRHTTLPTVTSSFESIRIKFGGRLHVNIARADLLGVQSWLDSKAGKFCIEYTLRGGSMLTEYDNRESFDAILEGLEKVLW